MILRRSVGALGLVVAVAVGHLVTSHLDINHSDTDPFVRSAEVGKVAHLSYADVEVTDVRPAQYVAGLTDLDFAKLAAGVFVLVSVKVTATRESQIFLASYLVDTHGRRYEKSGKASCAINVKSRTAVPGYALFCFDVPIAALPGLRFQLGRGSPITSSLRSDDLAEVDLGITGAEAERWASTKDVYAPETTSDKPIELTSVDLTETDS